MILLVLLSPAKAAAQMTPDVVCVGQTKHYWVTPNPIPGSTYVWTINGVVQPSITNEIWVTWDLPYTPAGSPYTISVQEKSAAGCFGAVKSGQVFLNDVLPVTITISAGQNPACAGTPVTFTATITNGGTTPAYQWFVNSTTAGPAATNATYTYTPAAGDQVTCEVNSNAACATNNPAMSAPVVMQITPAPTVNFIPCFENVTSVESRPFRLKGGLPLGGSYSGGAGVNNPAPGMFNPQAAPTGPVTVTYTYTNAANCTGSAQTIIQNNPAVAGFTCGSNWTDIRDNKVYPTVQLGTQCWMGSNLNHGNTIPMTQNQANNCVSERYCYSNATGNCDGPGAPSMQDGAGGLYQWDEMMQYETAQGAQDICPSGWHVPAETEWNVLLNFYGGNAFAGEKMQDLLQPGFHALPTGVVYQNEIWSFKDLATIFWTSTPVAPVKAISHGMNIKDPSVSYYESFRGHAFPVRCVRN
jgi:uncharacterized protein (TIGR02145 family)